MKDPPLVSFIYFSVGKNEFIVFSVNFVLFFI